MFAIERFMNEVQQAAREFEDDGVEVLAIQVDTQGGAGPSAYFTIRAADFFDRYCSSEDQPTAQS